MAIVRFYNVLRTAAGTVETPLPDDCRTVAQAVAQVAGQFPGLAEKLLGSDGLSLRAGLAALLDGRQVRQGDFETTELGEQSVLTLVEIIGGG